MLYAGQPRLTAELSGSLRSNFDPRVRGSILANAIFQKVNFDPFDPFDPFSLFDPFDPCDPFYSLDPFFDPFRRAWCWHWRTDPPSGCEHRPGPGAESTMDPGRWFSGLKCAMGERT